LLVKQLGNVLVGLEIGPGASQVLQTAATLAEAAYGQLTVLHVISQEEHDERTQDPSASQFADVTISETVRTLHDLVSAAGIDGRKVRCTARIGDSVEEVLKAAWETASILVIGMRRRSRGGKFLLGSTLQEVLLAADLPVVVVPIDTDEPSAGTD
jgi:nucleotide-binding universal stress UspA family protein